MQPVAGWLAWSPAKDLLPAAGPYSSRMLPGATGKALRTNPAARADLPIKLDFHQHRVLSAVHHPPAASAPKCSARQPLAQPGSYSGSGRSGVPPADWDPVWEETSPAHTSSKAWWLRGSGSQLGLPKHCGREASWCKAPNKPQASDPTTAGRYLSSRCPAASVPGSGFVSD